MASSLRSSLGRAVRALRSAAGYSQEDFADAVGLHRTHMGTLERGDANPTLDTLELIAKALRIPVSELLLAAETGRLPDITPIETRRPHPGRVRSTRVGRVAERGDHDRR